jgi:glycosyltransferase involved in cell wall biosynthesis
MTKPPKISMLTGVYNSARYLPDSIESILNQTEEDFEFILVNNGSTDGSDSILNSYAKQDSRIRILNLATPGHTEALNFGLTYARGTYIARQDTDDLSEPERFEKQYRYLDVTPDVDLIGSSAVTIDDAGHLIGRYTYPNDHQTLRKALLELRNPLPASTWMFRKSIIEKTGPYDAFFRKAQDYAFLMRLIDNFALGSLSEPLVSLRRRIDSITFNDNTAEQHRFALTARALYAKGLLRHNSFVNASNNADFLEEFNKWFADQKFHRPYNGARARVAARSFYNDGRLGPSLITAIKSLIMYPQFIPNKILRKNPYWNESYITIFRDMPK